MNQIQVKKITNVDITMDQTVNWYVMLCDIEKQHYQHALQFDLSMSLDVPSLCRRLLPLAEDGRGILLAVFS